MNQTPILKLPKDLLTLVEIIQKGGIIAYPTEAVFGLGCSPQNYPAVEKLLSLKHRQPDKGLILIGSNFNQFKEYILPIPLDNLEKVLSSWPGPYTWVFPTPQTTSKWLRGNHSSIAIRVTAHPIAKAICQQLNTPLVSTSANKEGEPPALSVKDIFDIFGNQLDAIVDGQLGGLLKPTEIKNAENLQIIRPS